jgi:DNA repair ATPase RecN
MNAPDRERWTARRVGPLDVDMLEQQRDQLNELREIRRRIHNAADLAAVVYESTDALDGLANLASHLLDLYEYDRLDAQQPLASRARRAISTVRSALLNLADVLDEEDGEAIELRWEAPDLHELLAQVAGAEIIDLEPVTVFPELNGGAV